MTIYFQGKFKIPVFVTTRMRSSRMRTGRSLTVCRSLLPGGGLLPGGCLFPGGSALGGSAPGGWCLLWGGVCSGGGGVGVSAPGGSDPRGGGRESTPGGCLLGGVGFCSQGGCGIPACTEADTPREQNDRHVQKYYLDRNFVAAGKNVKAQFYLLNLLNNNRFLSTLHVLGYHRS